jgi:trehalose/maltose hydrolase-like predicted phosphorylase
MLPSMHGTRSTEVKMRSFRVRVLALLVGPFLLAVAILAPGAARAAGSYVLSTTDHGSSYAPTFTGNGMLGVRVPATGQGYAGGSVPAQSELAGFYAQPPGDVQQRANIPTWSTLAFIDGGTAFSLDKGTVTAWHQSIDFHTGIVTTTATWRAPNGHVTKLTYQVLTDRARQYVGLVRLTFVPEWSGTATVADVIDGTPANLNASGKPESESAQTGKGWDDGAHRDWLAIQTVGTKIPAALASQTTLSPGAGATWSHLDASTDESVGQQAQFPVTSGQSYTVTKYVGVKAFTDQGDPAKFAQSQASSAARAGWSALLAANDRAWNALWTGRIDVLGNSALATMVNASEFYLWSSTRAGVNWSVSPAGLSSNGYNGHIFWDAETWMYPSLLAQHPDVAAGMNNYRFERLREAEQHAAATHYRGARFPWESALDGTEQIPPPVSVNSEGLYEIHITADVALAQWQYFLASGDLGWLRHRGWPVLSQAAAFWASRATRGSDGRYHINQVTGPDEENPKVNDEAYTNVAAKTVLADAVRAAHLLGISPPAKWSEVSSKLVVLVDRTRGIHPEFAGYGGQMVKQADVTLLQYPWQFPMGGIAQNDINYYVPRTDPSGPSMSDAVNSIDTSALGTPGCASFVYTQRSYEPFIRDVFDQFSETRTGGAFTFMTGIGGFLQEFLYGYTGFRWNPAGIPLDPSLSGGMSGVVVHNLIWRGRRLTITVGSRFTTVTLNSGRAVPIITRAGTTRMLRTGRSFRIATRRPDRTRTSDLVRCGNATASSAQPGAPALAAVDGSPATDWQPTAVPATLTAPLAASRSRKVRIVTVLWGREWPGPPAPNVHPPAGPVKTLRPDSYQLLVSTDGHSWRVVRTVNRTTGTLDVIHLGRHGVRARFLRIAITSASGSSKPMLQELIATR